MRVIGGEFRSRKLKSLPGAETRPTPDRLRETLFNILQTRIHGAIFMDAYAGTGAVGIEALSRGARRAIFVDNSRHAAALIRENLANLGLADRAEVFCGKSHLVLERIPADIVFLDPPYELTSEYERAFRALAEKRPALAIAQHSRRAELANEYGPLLKTREVLQGDNLLSFYERQFVSVPPQPAFPD